MAEFFLRNIVVVYFLYGLAFFCMGLVVWLESRRSSGFPIARAMVLLAGFGIIHGLHEWFEMFQRLAEADATRIPSWLLLNEIRIPHLVLSFVLLILFGVRLIYAYHRPNGFEKRFALFAAGMLFALWLLSAIATRYIYQVTGPELVTAIDVLARYILGIPGALLAAWAIFLEQRAFQTRGMPEFGRLLLWAAVALFLYGVVGQIFTPKSFIFPASVINSELFLQIFRIPVQLFRAIMAGLIAVLVIRALRAFDFERQQQLADANAARLTAQRNSMAMQQLAHAETTRLHEELQDAYAALQVREARRRELLQQVVSAQEMERQRIARELHDGAGQILTGLGLGLAAVSETIKTNTELAGQQLHTIRGLSGDALEELRRIIKDLRPAVLDDLGLVPALSGQVEEFQQRTGVSASLVVEGKRIRLQPEVETVIFRIAQEALNNVAKHARAQHCVVELSFGESMLQLSVCDDGRGFDPAVWLSEGVEPPRHAWGLLGIQERVALIGGSCEIVSQPGAGATIRVRVPLSIEEVSGDETH